MSRLRRLLLMTMLVLSAGCAPTHEPADEPAAAVGWRPLAASPLSPRTGANAFWTGTSVLVLGGFDDVSCPPNADCAELQPPLSDGAAYDPAADTWTELPDAPVPLGFVSGDVLDGTLYLWVPGLETGAPPAFLSLAPGEGAWVERDAPFEPGSPMSLVAAGDRLIAYPSTHEAGVEPDRMYDPATDAWAELPTDPLTPAFDRQMIWTDDALVLLGHRLVPQPGSEEPSVVRAARLDLDAGRWRPHPDSRSIGGRWGWTGDRLVNAAIGGADGGEANNWGRMYPYGGVLDPATGTWSELPGTPASAGDFAGFWAWGDGWAISGEGWAFHAASDTWVALRRPAARTAEEGQAAVWAGDRLFVFGGSRVVGNRYLLVDDAWSWTPPT